MQPVVNRQQIVALNNELREDVIAHQNTHPMLQSFRLLYLPFLAQEMIIQSMNASCIFLITFTFPRFLRMTKWRRKSKILQMLLEFSEENQEILVSFSGRPGTVVSFSNMPAMNVDRELWNFNGKWFGMRTVASNNPEAPLRFHYKIGRTTTLTQNLLDHFKQVFCITRIHLRATVTEITNFFPKNLKDISILEFQTSARDPNRREPAEDIDRLLDNLNVSRCVHINTAAKGFLKFNSRLLSAPSVVTSSHRQAWLTVEHLKCFGGKHFIANHALMSVDMLMDFINEWLDDETGKFENLEFLNVRSGAFFNLHNLEAQLIPLVPPEAENRRAQIYKSTYPYRVPNPAEFFDCSTAVDIERPSDGRLACIKYNSTSFVFFVWKNRFP